MSKWLKIVCAAVLIAESVHAQVHTFVQSTSDLKRAAMYGGRRSLSGQFVIRGPERTGWLPSLGIPKNIKLVRIDPTLLTMSCERVKQAFLRQLALGRDEWRGSILLQMHAARSLEENVVITSAVYGSEWTYKVDLPDCMEETRLVSSLVSVLLLEMANRTAAGRSAEIPAWLSEGMTQQVMSESSVDLVLVPPDRMQAGVNFHVTDWSGRRKNPLADAHAGLSQLQPLTLGQLSWPREEQLIGEAGNAFEDSAQLFVHELLHLRNGQGCFRAFLAELPKHYNWQLSLLDAYQEHFRNLLALEKWWTLKQVTFTGRDLAENWGEEESRQKLNEVILPQVQVRTATNEMPLHAETRLQAIVSDWDYARQVDVLKMKIRQLDLLRPNVSFTCLDLVDGYRLALHNYLAARDKNESIHPSKGGELSSAMRMIVKDALKELDRLDAKNAKTAQAENQGIPAATETASAVLKR